MNKNYTLIAILVSLFTSHFVFAQKIVEVKDMFVKTTSAKITIEKETERVKFIKFPSEKPMAVRGNSLKEKSMNFLDENKSIYGLQFIEKSLLFEEVKVDNYGLKNAIFKQYHKGVPVFDGELRIHFNSQEKITSTNGNVFPYIKLNEIPDLSKAEASSIALQVVKEENLNNSGKALIVKKSELFVFKKGLVQGYNGAYHLVYRIEIANEADVREYLFIDAHDGGLVEQFTGIAHVIDRELYDNGSIVWKEGDAFPGTLNQDQKDIVETSSHAYHFFNNAFGYASYDGLDAKMTAISNALLLDGDGESTCPNATWNGTTTNFCEGVASDDIVAHEWAHAYTEYTSDLIYAYQSGALNESYSDIWGETIDLLNEYEDEGENLSIKVEGNCRGSVRWKFAEDATAFGGAIRDLWTPTCNRHPGKTSDSEYNCSSSDNGGVHTNSGIPNHAYALLVDGGTYNGQSISRLGFTKAAHIFWRAQSVYLTRTSDFSDFADALEAAGADLIGINLQGLSTDSPATGLSGEIITQADLDELSKVILAVELRISPSTCNFNTILTATDPLCDASTNNPLFSEDWESGMGDWTVEQLPTDSSTWESRDWVISSSLPEGRVGSGMFGADPINGNCTTDLQNGIIRLQSPIITIPDISEGIFEMTFDHYISTESLWDGGNVKYRLNGSETWTLVPGSSFINNPYNATLKNLVDDENDNPMESQEAFSGGDETPNGPTDGSWGKSTIDLSSLGVVANSQIEFRWEMGTDGCNGDDGWYLDEIVIYNCSAVLAVSKYALLLQDISVYPNPTTDTFTIRKLASLNLMKAEVFDLNGRKLKEVDLSEMVISQDIDINELATGIYFVTVTSEDAKATVKLVKQ
jgi:bacillolysin